MSSLADEFEKLIAHNGLTFHDDNYEWMPWVYKNRDRILAALRRNEELEKWEAMGFDGLAASEDERIAAIVRNPTDEQAQEIGSSPFYDEQNRLRPNLAAYHRKREGRDACKAILYLATGNEK
jgi:hypothetical protein